MALPLVQCIEKAIELAGGGVAGLPEFIIQTFVIAVGVAVNRHGNTSALEDLLKPMGLSGALPQRPDARGAVLL